MVAYQSALLWLQANASQIPPMMPQPPVPPQIPEPFTPFPARPNDTEPKVAAEWMKRLSHLQFSPSYSKQPPEWREIADTRYTQARQAVATASGAGQPQPQPQALGAPTVPPPSPARGAPPPKRGPAPQIGLHGLAA